MPPKAAFASIIKTRPKNKDVHPGNVVNHDDDGNPKPKRRTPEEVKKVHHQQEIAQKTAEQNIQNAIAVVGLVEDSLREEDIARQTRPNRRLENVSAFRPPASAAKRKDSSKKPEEELQDQIDGDSFEPNYLTLLLLMTYLPDLDTDQLEGTVPSFQLPATVGKSKALPNLKEKERYQDKGQA